MSQTEEELGSRKKARPPVLEESRSMLGMASAACVQVCRDVGKARVNVTD